MKYYPKTQQKLKSTTKEDNFIYSDTKEKYTGFYILTSDSSYFAGKILNRNARRLEKLRPLNTSYSIGSSNNVLKHTLLKSTIYSDLSQIKPIPLIKPRPTKADYELGYFNRYFIKRINQEFGIKEISKKTFKEMTLDVKKYDIRLYNRFFIKWDLGENAIIENEKNIKFTENRHKYDIGLTDLLLFFTILNEYQSPILKTKTNLNTEGGELYNKDGSEYIGEYHIHSTKGPMVGPIHTNTYHDKLYYLDQIPKQKDVQDTVEEDFEEHLKKQRLKKIKDLKFNPIRPSVSQDTRSTLSRGESTPNRGNISTPSSGRGGY